MMRNELAMVLFVLPGAQAVILKCSAGRKDTAEIITLPRGRLSTGWELQSI